MYHSLLYWEVHTERGTVYTVDFQFCLYVACSVDFTAPACVQSSPIQPWTSPVWLSQQGRATGPTTYWQINLHHDLIVNAITEQMIFVWLSVMAKSWGIIGCTYVIMVFLFLNDNS